MYRTWEFPEGEFLPVVFRIGWLSDSPQHLREIPHRHSGFGTASIENASNSRSDECHSGCGAISLSLSGNRDIVSVRRVSRAPIQMWTERSLSATGAFRAVQRKRRGHSWSESFRNVAVADFHAVVADVHRATGRPDSRIQRQ